MEEVKEVKKKMSCKKCGSTFGYMRIFSKDFKCRSCGYETDIEEKKE